MCDFVFSPSVWLIIIMSTPSSIEIAYAAMISSQHKGIVYDSSIHANSALLLEEDPYM